MKSKIISKVFLVLFSFIILLYVSYYTFRPQSIPVLAYHDLKPESLMSDAEKEDYFIGSVEMFEKQMKYIHDNNYKTLSMNEFYCWMKSKCKFPKKTVVITFDDGNASIYNYVLPILKKYNLKGTSFVVLSRLINDKDANESYNFLTFEMMERAKREYENLEFHSHTFDLHSRTEENKAFVFVKNEEELKDDIKKVSEIIETEFIAYPFGAYTQEYINVLKERGYKLGFKFEVPFYRAKQSDNLFEIPRVSMDGKMPFWRFKTVLRVGLVSKNNLFLIK